MIRPNILAVIALYTVAVVLLACITYPGIAHAKPQTVRGAPSTPDTVEITDTRKAWLDSLDAPTSTLAVATYIEVKATTTPDAQSILEKPHSASVTVTASVARKPLSNGQINAILGLLSAFGVDDATRVYVERALRNTL